MRPNPTLTTLAAALAALLSPAAGAQTAPPAPAATAAPAAAPTAAPAAASPEQALERIVISGQRDTGLQAREASAGALGELPLLDTPFSIQVIPRALLDQQQAVTVNDFLKNDPSAVVSNVPVGFLTLRGFPLGNDGALYDGLPGHLGLTDGRGQLEGIERIEVLKGVSSFLYGMGNATSLGGVLNYVPKRPTGGDVRSVELRWTSRSLLGVAADLGGRFGEGQAFGWRLNAGWQDGEQATEGYHWGHRVGALALDWRATPGVLLSAQHETAHNDLPRLQPFFVLSPGLAVPDAPDAERNIAQRWDNFQTRSSNTLLRADVALDPRWQLVAQALHNEHDRPPVLNARFGLITGEDGSALLFGDQYAWGVRADTAQVLLRGQLDLAGASHALTVGASHHRALDFNSTSDDAVNGGVPFATNLYDPVYADRPERIALRHGLSNRAQASSLLLSDLVQLGPRWSALLGLRHGRLSTQAIDILSGGASPAQAQSATTPTLALTHKPTPDSALYLNYGEGLEQGGTAPDGATNGGRRMAPLRTRQVELGGKLAWGRLNLAAALFDMKRPSEYSRANDDGSFTYVQDGLQRHRGLELTAAGQALPTLDVVAGLMWLDPRVERSADAAAEGKRPVGVPVNTANLWLHWRLPQAPGWSLQGGVFHSGPQYLDSANTQRVPGYQRLDAGAALETAWGRSRATLRLLVENLTDADYWTGGQSGLLVLSDPRKFKASLQLAW